MAAVEPKRTAMKVKIVIGLKLNSLLAMPGSLLAIKKLRGRRGGEEEGSVRCGAHRATRHPLSSR
jgi:hypothetical protein